MSAALLAALQRIADVEPMPRTARSARLDITDWADALDKAQAIAREALAEWDRSAA